MKTDDIELINKTLNDTKRNQLTLKKEKSFWASWFSFGTSFSDSDDSDDEKPTKLQKKKHDNKINDKNFNDRALGSNIGTMSTRKSSACKFTNFNAPDQEEIKNLRSNRVSTRRTLR